MNKPQSETPDADAMAIAARQFVGKGGDFVSLADARTLEGQRDAALTDLARFEQGVESLTAQLDEARFDYEGRKASEEGSVAERNRLLSQVESLKAKLNALWSEKKIVGEDNDALRAEVERLTNLQANTLQNVRFWEHSAEGYRAELATLRATRDDVVRHLQAFVDGIPVATQDHGAAVEAAAENIEGISNLPDRCEPLRRYLRALVATVTNSQQKGEQREALAAPQPATAKGATVRRDAITFYELKFYMFSNFSAFAVQFDGRLWPTSEHAYQAMKFTDHATQEVVRQQRSAHEAMKYAQSIESNYRPNWHKEKTAIMLEICRAKLHQHPYIQRKLVETGERELIESSPTDSFWGWGPNKDGQNHLGRVWMTLRHEWNALRTSDPLAAGAQPAAPATQESQQKGGEEPCSHNAPTAEASMPSELNAVGSNAAPTSDPEGAATQIDLSAEVEIEALKNRVIELERALQIRDARSATPPSITDAANEILDAHLLVKNGRNRKPIESILSCLLGAQAGEVKRLRKELSAVRACFAEASHNAGPAFVAHEKLASLETEVAQLRQDAKQLREALEYVSPVLDVITRIGRLAQGGEQTGNWMHVAEANKIVKAAMQPSEEPEA